MLARRRRRLCYFRIPSIIRVDPLQRARAGVALLRARPPSPGADARAGPHHTPSLRHPPSVWYKFLDGERGGETQTSPTCESAGAAVSAASAASDVQSVRLSRRSCMMSVESLYDSSESVSSSAIASSKACLAMWQARSGELRIS